MLCVPGVTWGCPFNRIKGQCSWVKVDSIQNLYNFET